MPWMNHIGQPARAPQDRVLALFRDELGYRNLGDWTHRAGNSNIEEALLTADLGKSGCSAAHVANVLYALRTEAGDRIAALTDRFMPTWQFDRAELNRLLVRHKDWATHSPIWR